jgi:hypothetical protein
MREQPADQNGCSVSNGEAAPPVKRKKKKKWRSSSARQRVSFRPPSHDHASLSCPGVSGRAEEPGFGASPCVC